MLFKFVARFTQALLEVSTRGHVAALLEERGAFHLTAELNSACRSCVSHTKVHIGAIRVLAAGLESIELSAQLEGNLLRRRKHRGVRLWVELKGCVTLLGCQGASGRSVLGGIRSKRTGLTFEDGSGAVLFVSLPVCISRTRAEVTLLHLRRERGINRSKTPGLTRMRSLLLLDDHLLLVRRAGRRVSPTGSLDIT